MLFSLLTHPIQTGKTRRTVTPDRFTRGPGGALKMSPIAASGLAHAHREAGPVSDTAKLHPAKMP